MSRGARLGLVALAALIAAVVFVVARPGDDEESTGAADRPAPRTAADEGGTREPTATAESAPEPPVEVRLRGRRPAGGVQAIEVEAGEQVRLAVLSDAPDSIHVHGYELERAAAPRRPAVFRFTADLEGDFEVESHAAGREGEEPLIARLVVKPG